MKLSNERRAGFEEGKRRTMQRGFTLVELLVAMVISLLVALAAVAALIASRQGFSGVDAASQLRDNSRFVSELVQRVVVQAGYQTVATTRKASVAWAGRTPIQMSAARTTRSSLTPPFHQTSRAALALLRLAALRHKLRQRQRRSDRQVSRHRRCFDGQLRGRRLARS